MAAHAPGGREREEQHSRLRSSGDWSFAQLVPRKSYPRRWTGTVHYVTGPEGERLRDEIAAAVHDLLCWAAEDAEPSPDALGPGGPDRQSRTLGDL